MSILRSFNLPSIVSSVLGAHSGEVTLTKRASGNRSPTNLPGGTNSSVTNHKARGYVADYKTEQIQGTIIQGDRCVVIYAATLRDVVPAPGDRITVDGRTYAIMAIEDGGSSDSLHVCQVRG